MPSFGISSHLFRLLVIPTKLELQEQLSKPALQCARCWDTHQPLLWLDHGDIHKQLSQQSATFSLATIILQYKPFHSEKWNIQTEVSLVTLE